MYDPLETEISREQLNRLIAECENGGIPIALIGGWAAYFYVNETYKRAFGKNYMGSRDIDLFVSPERGEEFHSLIVALGFEENGMYFRWERLYDRETKKFITSEDAKKVPVFNIIYIFLDLFCSKKIDRPKTWCDLLPLVNFNIKRDIEYFETIPAVKMDTLIDLKCTAIFARDKADKENKDACDLYALLNYSNRKFIMTELLKKTIEKILSRNDLLHAISEHVLLDASRQSIVTATLKLILKETSK